MHVPEYAWAWCSQVRQHMRGVLFSQSGTQSSDANTSKTIDHTTYFLVVVNKVGESSTVQELKH